MSPAPVTYPEALLAGQLAQARFQATPHCGFSKHAPAHSRDHRDVPDYDLHYVTKGAMEYVYADRSVCVNADSFCLMPPRRQFLERNDKPTALYYIHFEVAIAGADPLLGLDMPLVVRAKNPAAAQKQFADLQAAVLSRRTSVWGNFHANAALLQLLAMVLQDAYHSGAVRFAPQRAAPEWLDEVLKSIDAAVPDSSVDVDALAQLAHLSPSHFAHQFRRYAGISPKQMLLKRRMDVAGALLLNSDMAVKEISLRCGYPDPYQFSAIFKKWTRLSPTDYRNRRSGS
jgi:AraC-like DNA-binding protein